MSGIFLGMGFVKKGSDIFNETVEKLKAVLSHERK
jgi:hypothetical protein